MSAGRHPFGCDCRTHVPRPWNRPEHWSVHEVAYLERSYGLVTDEAMVRRLGRSIVGIKLKAKRLGLHKRAAGFSARDIGSIFGVDASTVGKVWIRRGLLRSRRPFRQGPHLIHIVDPADVETFIREHPEWIDVDKMPDSPYRDLAAADPWIGTPEVHRRTGRSHHAVAKAVAAGVIRGRRRGAHWFVPAADLPRLRSLAPDAIADSVFRRESTLEMRRYRRKAAA